MVSLKSASVAPENIRTDQILSWTVALNRLVNESDACLLLITFFGLNSRLAVCFLLLTFCLWNGELKNAA